MKIIAYYLPQFHEIPENNEMWGKGFTEWTNVKNAKPLFEGHEQPVEPLDDNYYNLLDSEVMRWQTKSAKENGVFGFCFYHYWYNGHLLLEKPIELFLKNKDINMPFCICWANHNWSTSWKNNENRVIYKQDYSDKNDWKSHFDYLLPYFLDERYIKHNGKPLVVIYEIANIPQMNEMLDCWQLFAREHGLPGLDIAYQSASPDLIYGFKDNRCTYDIEYQPQYVREFVYKKNERKKLTVYSYIRRIIGSVNIPQFLKDRILKISEGQTPLIVDYDDIWEKILSMRPIRPNSIPGALVRMDTTPRKQNRGFVTQGMTVEKFKKYLKRQIVNARDNYKSDMLFMFAWNEWAEGGYLEPDKRDGYKVLNAIKEALEETGEMPK